jgi:16S rRNA (guanine527-N7)-methyltransferase
MEKKKIAEISQIKTWCELKGLSISQSQLERFGQYLSMVREFSKKMNLVSKKDLPSLAERHLVDSLNALAAYEFPQGAIVADLGSGAGFPGIPIAIARPDLSITLIESRRLKCLFLEKVVSELALFNVIVVHSRWEKLSDKFDVILSRAVYPEPELLKIALLRLRPSGVLLYFEKYMKIKIIGNPSTGHT